jgi:hypothetical protein
MRIGIPGDAAIAFTGSGSLSGEAKRPFGFTSHLVDFAGERIKDFDGRNKRF